MLLVAEDDALCGLFTNEETWGRFLAEAGEPDDEADPRRATAPLEAAAAQLREYFAGERLAFDVPLSLRGTPFQERVWRALLDIPFGTTRTYGEQADAIGEPQAVRAVGAANGQNPISIIVPCHRVVGRNGKLVGYGGGLPIKKALLAHEAKVAATRAPGLALFGR